MPISLEADSTLPQGYIKVNGTTAATLDATGITTGGVPAGAVMAYAMNSAPTGWLAADGAAVSRSEYARLFAAVGTTHGVGNGSTTFNLPDLRGYFVRGSGTNSDGTAAGTFGAKQADDFKSHTHTVFGAQGGPFTSTGIYLSGVTGTNVTSAATGGTETRPKNIAMLYCVKF
jgi:microcystin-dependent protein